MNQLAVDLGAYSVKFYETIPEGKSLKLAGYEEIPLSQLNDKTYDDLSLQEKQMAIVAKYLRQNEFKGKVISQLPNEMMTTRFLDLPVPNRRKAEMMIPFQLEENLPYPISNTHITSLIHKKNKENFAQVNVTEKDFFSELYKYQQERDILPAVITSELFSLQSFLIEKNINNSFCFVDIGHQTTKAYFINDGLIVANHVSHVAGETIDEVISQTYDIPHDEAVIYKHENCFFLTEDQMNEVNEDQKDFAILMKKSVWQLVLELRRWEVGFRVKYGKQVDQVFITGGTTNISNLDHFLSEHLGLPVLHFKPYSDLHYDIVGVDEEMKNSMAISHIMTSAQMGKITAPNFLHSDFPSGYSDSIPLHSSVFIGARIAIVAVLLALGLFVERVFIQQDIQTVDRVVVNQLQSSDLQLPRRIRDLYRTQPQRIYSEINQMYNRANNELNSLKQAMETDAMAPFVQMHEEIPENERINLVKVLIDSGFVETQFKSDSASELEKLQDHLYSLRKNDTVIIYNNQENLIDFSFRTN